MVTKDSRSKTRELFSGLALLSKDFPDFRKQLMSVADLSLERYKLEQDSKMRLIWKINEAVLRSTAYNFMLFSAILPAVADLLENANVTKEQGEHIDLLEDLIENISENKEAMRSYLREINRELDSLKKE